MKFFFSQIYERKQKIWIDVTSSTEKKLCFIDLIDLIVKAIDFFEVQFLYLYFEECKLKNK